MPITNVCYFSETKHIAEESTCNLLSLTIRILNAALHINYTSPSSIINMIFKNDTLPAQVCLYCSCTQIKKSD